MGELKCFLVIKKRKGHGIYHLHWIGTQIVFKTQSLSILLAFLFPPKNEVGTRQKMSWALIGLSCLVAISMAIIIVFIVNFSKSEHPCHGQPENILTRRYTVWIDIYKSVTLCFSFRLFRAWVFFSINFTAVLTLKLLWPFINRIICNLTNYII